MLITCARQRKNQTEQDIKQGLLSDGVEFNVDIDKVLSKQF